MNFESEHDNIQADFSGALANLIAGKPTNKKLIEKAKAGKLRINISNVALEAGRSRTLIALRNTKYPEVRTAILSVANRAKSVPNKDRDTLKKKIKQLEFENRQLASHVAALMEQYNDVLRKHRSLKERNRKLIEIR